MRPKTTKIAAGPLRFDPFVDFYDSKRPGPATYTPVVLRQKKAKGSARQQAIRMKKREYETISPGPGSYRLQSEFGIYSPEDATNRVEAHEIHQAIAAHRGSSPHLTVP